MRIGIINHIARFCGKPPVQDRKNLLPIEEDEKNDNEYKNSESDSKYGFHNTHTEEERDEAANKIKKFVRERIDYFKSCEVGITRANKWNTRLYTTYTPSMEQLEINPKCQRREYVHFLSYLGEGEIGSKYRRNVFNITQLDMPLENHPSGGSKVLTAENPGHLKTLVLWKYTDEIVRAPAFTPYAIQNILARLRISDCFMSQFALAKNNKTYYVTHSAGNVDLYGYKFDKQGQPIEGNEIDINLFWRLMKAIEKLNENKFYLFDIKPDNIVVEFKEFTNKEILHLTIVDIEQSFSSLDEYNLKFGTPGYMHFGIRDLVNEVKSKGLEESVQKKLIALILSFSDIYELVMTMLETTDAYRFFESNCDEDNMDAKLYGNAFDRSRWYTSYEDRTMARQFDKHNKKYVISFIDEYIKPEYSNLFMFLVKDPVNYIRPFLYQIENGEESGFPRLSSMFKDFR